LILFPYIFQINVTDNQLLYLSLSLILTSIEEAVTIEQFAQTPEFVPSICRFNTFQNLFV